MIALRSRTAGTAIIDALSRSPRSWSFSSREMVIININKLHLPSRPGYPFSFQVGTEDEIALQSLTDPRQLASACGFDRLARDSI